MVESLSTKEIVEYPNGGKSYFYVTDRTVIIVDEGICKCDSKDEVFPYTLITDKQNYYMHRYEKVYRFIAEDRDTIESVVQGSKTHADMDFTIRVANREENADASPLELLFERNFTNVYGMDALKYLWKEYGVVDALGHNYFLDYYVRTGDGGIAVEENGVSYHHPQVIGLERYRKQLQKQNTCTQWGIKLYRFSTEDCQFESRIEDDIRSFFGEDVSSFEENGLLIDRPVKLYEHQVATLQDIEQKRKEGVKTFLIVFPTASGKSRIVEEDMRAFAKGKTDFKALVLAPNTNIVKDWHRRIEESLKEYQDRIEINTFAYIVRNYTTISPKEYSYIVIDEAHHAVAPMLKRVIQYFTPEFMVGLTATDQRPDKKKLESVFGSYTTGLSLIQAMEEGIVAQANVYRIETNIDLSHVRFNGRDYINADLEKSIRVTSRNELIVNVLQEYFCEGEVANRQGIIFCVNTKHTVEMEKLLHGAGISAKSYTGQTKNAEKVMADFKEKKIRFLCACNMISEGWDYPELGILVMARPTLSKVLYLQQIGRGLRKTDVKKNVFVIDVVDEYGAMARPCSMHSIFQNLYKTYHKKEYRQLKRFSKITVPEIFSLAETEDFGCDYYAIARIMGMCVFYGIELHERCSILYLVLGKARKDLDEEEKLDFFSFPDGLFQECYDQVEEWMGQGGNTPKLRRKALENFWRADRFAEVCLQRQGYPEDYLYRCNIEYRGIERLLAQTLAVLKSAYPDEEFSFEEVQIYSFIAHGIDALVSVCDDYHDIVSELFGIGPDMHESGEGLFKPENIAYKEAPKAKMEAKPVNIAPVASEDVKEEDYLKEIEELRRRLREKEEECKHFRRQYEHVKVSLSDAREVIAQNENYMEERIALRNYVYGLSQEVPPITEDKLEDMKCAIAEKSVVIIGGHINWINKLKKEFPNWRYLDANISRVNDSKLVEDADMVYFFTDHLSHGTYGKFVKSVRENRIPFGYMHSVNMESLVRQVFKDLG